MKKIIFLFLAGLILDMIFQNAIPYTSAALVLFGNGVSEMRGSVAGTVFSKNKAGAYARNRTTPVNPQTEAQLFARLLFSNVSSTWSGLSSAIIDSWNNAAGLQERTNRIGQIYTPTGKQLYQEVNSNLTNSGQTTVTSVPVNFDAPNSLSGLDSSTISGSTITNNLDGLTMDLLNDPAVTTGVYSISATAPHSPSKTNVKNQFKFIQNESVSGASPQTIDILAAYLNVFGNVSQSETGKKISVRVKAVGTNGIVSPDLSFQYVIPAYV